VADLKAEALATRADPRGFVFEPLSATELGAMRNCHVVISVPGAIRGNHYHPAVTETMAVVGPAHVRVRADGKLHDVHVEPGAVVRFTFAPGVAHAIRNTGTAPGVIVAFADDESHDAVPDRILD